MLFYYSISFLCSIGFHVGHVLTKQSKAACVQDCLLAWCWVSFQCRQDMVIFVNRTSNFELCHYHIDKLVTIKASMSINFLHLKWDQIEPFMAGSCHQPKPTWTSNPSLKFNLGSSVKNLMWFLIASSFSIAVKRVRLFVISWNKCAVLIAPSCFYVP